MLLEKPGLVAELDILHPEEPDLAHVDIVPYCLSVPASKTGSPHPCL